MHDVLFRNALVIDGTGGPGYGADVAVQGDRITSVGTLDGSRARRVVNVDGAVLAPGFIDLHTHSDFTLPVFPRAHSMIRQGVTTQVVGNCGFSPFPVAPERLDLLRSYSEFLDAGLTWEWEGAGEFGSFLEGLPLVCNIALQVGHGTLRIATMGFEDRDPTPSELGRMQALLAQAFEEGAVGFSTGLTYVPGGYSKTDEIIALARVAAEYGGFYSTHIRDESSGLCEAVAEALRIGRETGAPVQLSHHKVMGKSNWGSARKSLQMIDDAREAGVDVLADQYPYTAGSTSLAVIMPRWVMDKGIVGMLERLSHAPTRARVSEEIVNGPPSVASRIREFDPEQIVIASTPHGPHKQFEGMRLVDIAAERHEAPVEVALRLLESSGGGVQMIVFSMCEEDVTQILKHPAVAIASDGWILDPRAGGKPHPRNYGTFARLLGKYVREEAVVGLEEGVRKITSLPATRLGCSDRGFVRPSCLADLVIFDPETIRDRATFTEPHEFSEGVSHVIVNGEFLIDAGEDTGASAGRLLRHRVPRTQ